MCILRRESGGRGGCPPCPPAGPGGPWLRGGPFHLLALVALVHLLALEAKLGAHVPCSHPGFAWLVEFASDLLTKYVVGKGGKTAHERIWGKSVREEGLEFGEQLRWRPPAGPSRGVLLERRWRQGIWAPLDTVGMGGSSGYLRLKPKWLHIHTSCIT